jgi:DNA-binding NtrC family response regulator
LKALHKHNGNQTEAAKELGLPLRTLVHKISTYGIKKKFDQ